MAGALPLTLTLRACVRTLSPLPCRPFWCGQPLLLTRCCRWRCASLPCQAQSWTSCAQPWMLSCGSPLAPGTWLARCCGPPRARLAWWARLSAGTTLASWRCATLPRARPTSPGQSLTAASEGGSLLQQGGMTCAIALATAASAFFLFYRRWHRGRCVRWGYPPLAAACTSHCF